MINIDFTEYSTVLLEFFCLQKVIFVVWKTELLIQGRNNVQKVLYAPEADADASHCTLCRACLAAAVQIPDLVFHKCRMP